MNFSNVAFVKSAANLNDCPNDNKKHILFVGKSNVGKSSLINCLVNKHNLAFSSSKPGLTKLLNFFLVDNKVYFVDAPGYGFHKLGVKQDEDFGEMMNEYFSKCKNLSFVVLLIDSRREISAGDISLINFFNKNKIDFCLVASKVDKLNQKGKSKLLKNIKEAGISSFPLFMCSVKNLESINALKGAIEKKI